LGSLRKPGLVKRFDGFLERVSRESEPAEEQRGILLLAHSEMRERLESISRKFHHMGTRWGEVRFLVKCRGSRRRRIAAYFRSPISAQTPRAYFEKGLARQFN
jgi:hypothetical protein